MTVSRLVVGLTWASLAILSQVNTPQAQTAAGPTLYSTAQTSAASFWTPERFANATPMDLPIANASTEMTAVTGMNALTSSGEPEFRDGREGRGREVNKELFNPADFPQSLAAENEGRVQPNNAGVVGAHFTSTRVIPKNADKKYPWRATGRLFFSIPGGTAWCTASAIGARIIVTAGHCVHSGNGEESGYYSNWVFIPAYRNGNAPYLSWSWSMVTTTPRWFNSGGNVPNAADYAMILVPDQVYNGNLTRIGDVIGWYGWQTLSLSQNHVTQLGYPSNLDSGEIMHQVTAGAFQDAARNNVEYGSDMRQGSSGGPWVQNFSELADGQAATGLNAGVLRVVGVTSYAYDSSDLIVLGASIPDVRWSKLFNRYCRLNATNCS